MNPSALRLAVLTMLVLLACTTAATAQNSGAITGILVDPHGAVVPGASIQALDDAKGVVARDTTSNEDGIFQLQPLQPGTYTLVVKANGMKELRRKGLTLDSRQVLGLGQLQMSLGSVNETMTVEAQTPLVEVANADHSDVIDSKLVTETSLNGRDFQSLVKTLPGVVSNDSSDFRLAFNNTNAFHVNGMRGSQNNFFLDGAVNTDVGANDGQFTQLSMDAVGEFKLLSNNFGAEYGRNPGVIMEVNTKSGGRQFHGTLYEFNREDGFDAAPFGSQGNKGVLRFHQYGGNVGGPIPVPHFKDKLFFFFNYEGTKAIQPNSHVQYASATEPGLGIGYKLPDPRWLGIGTPNGDLDFTSAYQFDPNTHAPLPLGSSGFQQGQIFVPGSITGYDSSGNPTGGTPICGTVSAPCNIVPKSMLSSQAPAMIRFLSQGYLPGFVPDPQSPNNGGLFSKVFVPFIETYRFNKHQEVVRIDFNVNSKTNFFFRWVDDSQQEQFHNIFDFADYPILPEFRKKPGSSWSWNLVNVISPTMTNEFIFSYNHLTQLVDVAPGTPTSTFDRDALGFTFQELFPLANVDNRFPQLGPCCNGTFSGGVFHPGWHSEARMFTWTDNVTKVFGPHTFKTGVFFDYNQAGQQPSWTDNTSFNFATGAANPNDSFGYTANMLLGNYQTVTQSNGIFFGAFRFHQVEAYGQDTWKVNRKLTLDYGLRWAYLGPTYTVQPFFQNYFDPARYDFSQKPGIYGVDQPAPTPFLTGSFIPGVGDPFNGMVQEGKGIPPGFAKHRYNNFGPRFGFAYDPTGSGKTAIRGGAGIFYERIRQNINSFDGLGNPPLTYTPTVPAGPGSAGNIDNVGPGIVTGVRFPVGINAFDREGQIPTTYSWSFGVQRELPWQLGLEATYVGNQARHLQYQFNLEAVPLGTFLVPPDSFAQPALVPFPGYSFINFTKYDANSSYNGLQIKATRRFHQNLTLTADYTFSKSTDLTDADNPGADPNTPSASNGGPGNITDPYHPQLDYAPAGWDRRHVFNFNYVYTLPRFANSGALKWIVNGWEISGITRFWSGAPLDITINGNPGNLIGLARPDAPTGPVYVNNDDHIHWFDPSVFTRPADGSVGTVRRNAFRGPGINNWDISVFKNFEFTESMKLQLRLETFNTFNHTQPSAINTSLTGANLPGDQAQFAGTNMGQITGYRDPRTVQLGIKMYF